MSLFFIAQARCPLLLRLIAWIDAPLPRYQSDSIDLFGAYRMNRQEQHA